jgi:hypothetical protein
MDVFTNESCDWFIGFDKMVSAHFGESDGFWRVIFCGRFPAIF